MSARWLITMKPSFATEWLALPQKEVPHILDKIRLLMEDPTPFGDLKKLLKYKGAHLYRIRCGDYRILYTYQFPYIGLLYLRPRNESTYGEEFGNELLGGIDPALLEDLPQEQPDFSWEQFLTKLPKPSNCWGLRLPRWCAVR